MDLIDIIVKLQPRTACIMVFVDTSMWHVRSSISDNLGQNIWDTWWKYRKTPPPTLNVGLGLSRLPVTHLVLFNITQHWEWGRGGSSEPLFTSFLLNHRCPNIFCPRLSEFKLLTYHIDIATTTIKQVVQGCNFTVIPIKAMATQCDGSRCCSHHCYCCCFCCCLLKCKYTNK